MKILLVDDDQTILVMMAKLLRHRGHEVQTCATPFGVSAVIVRDKPEVVVIDVMMPGLGGASLAALVARIEVEPRPLVILWSAMDDDALAKTGRQAGGLATISKAMRATDIAAAIERTAATDKSRKRDAPEME
jgi:DNA-binding response OmpR family regulator